MYLKLAKVNKRIQRRLGFVFFIVMFTGVIVIALYCKERRVVYEVTPYDKETLSNDVVILIEPNVIEAKRGVITITTKNNTNDEIYHSSVVALEVELEDEWYQVPYKNEPIWQEASIVIPAFGSYSEDFDLRNYFEISKGSYRIIKTYYQNQEKIISAGYFFVE